MKDTNFAKPGTFIILYTDGRQVVFKKKPTYPELEKLLGFALFTTITLDKENEQVMLLDDEGLLKDSLPNLPALALVFARRGQMHDLRGNVAIVNDSDFEQES